MVAYRVQGVVRLSAQAATCCCCRQMMDPRRLLWQTVPSTRLAQILQSTRFPQDDNRTDHGSFTAFACLRLCSTSLPTIQCLAMFTIVFVWQAVGVFSFLPRNAPPVQSRPRLSRRRSNSIPFASLLRAIPIRRFPQVV